MRYVPLFIILLIIIASCSQQPKDCSIFKTGTFKFTDKNFEGTIVTRNDSIQVEFDKTTSTKFTATIEWLSDCQYRLTYKEVSDPKLKDIIGTKFTVDIRNIYKSTYKYRAYNEQKEIIGEMIKVKE